MISALRFEFILLAAVSLAEAQQAKKVPLIEYLSALDPAREFTRSEAIRQALRELGYVEGQNIAIEYRSAEGKVDRFTELAAELVRLKVDIIVAAGGDRLILAAKNATKTIPIVMMGTGADPVDVGLVENRLPALYPRGDWLASGGLMIYGPDEAEPYRRGAVLVDKILRGAKPANLPVEQPTKFDLGINLKTAKQIGLTIPPNVLARADKVIK